MVSPNTYQLLLGIWLQLASPSFVRRNSFRPKHSSIYLLNYAAWGVDDRAPRCEASPYNYIEFIRPEVMTTAHLAAKPLLTYNFYIYWICGHQHKLATWHSLAAFEPYSHWPHPSLTVLSAWGDNDRAPCCEASPMSCVVYTNAIVANAILIFVQ